ncbi:MAG: 8-amino-7-oxononanoate synthase [Nocardioides sp.]
MTGRWRAWLDERSAVREAGGLRRRLHARGAADDLVDLAGTDYLGLSRHPDVVAAASAAAHQWGAGAGASRLVTGSLELHADLEAELADFMEQPSALVLSTGYHANLAAVTALVDRSCLVVSDAHVHASLVDAIRLSRAEVAIVPHNDLAAVSSALAGAGDRRALVVVESVYSVLGDASPLADLAALTTAYDAMLLVDEAHGLGVAGVGGRGLVHAQGLAGRADVLVTATLSKALGAQGGAVLGGADVIEHLVNTARPFIFDTGLAPAATGAARAALDVVRADPALPERVRERMRVLADALDVRPVAGAVLSVPMPSPRVALKAQAAAREDGVLVGCFRPPSVPDGVSRLRITVGGGIPDAEWARAADTVGRVVKEHGER